MHMQSKDGTPAKPDRALLLYALQICTDLEEQNMQYATYSCTIAPARRCNCARCAAVCIMHTHGCIRAIPKRTPAMDCDTHEVMRHGNAHITTMIMRGQDIFY